MDKKLGFLLLCFTFNADAFFWRNAAPKLTDKIFAAVKQDQSTILDALLAQDTSDANAVDNEGKTPLIIACQEGCGDSVHVLLSFNVDVNRKDKKHGATAIFYASREGDEAIIKKLIMSGSDVNVKNKLGQTCLHIASYYGKAFAVELMLFAGATCDIKAKGAGNKTPLMYAARNGHAEVVKLLLEAGAKPDLQDAQGKTALIYAATFGHADVVRVLLAYDAKTSIKDNKNNDALYYTSLDTIKNLLQLA